MLSTFIELFAHLPWWMYPVLFVAGIVAGIMNTVGGGGSIVTLPVLMFAGLPTDVANATNRIGIIAQNGVALRGFRKAGVRSHGLGWKLLLATSLGAVPGAWLAVLASDGLFKTVLGVLILALLPLLILRPKPRLLKDGAPEDPWAGLSNGQRAGLLATFFVLGVYAGFIQAGMGIMCLLVLGWFLRMDLVRGNYIKLVVTLGPQLLALITFATKGVAIDLAAGALMAGGQMLGGRIGTEIAIRKGENVIVALLAVSIVLSSAELLGLRRWLTTMLMTMGGG